MKGKLLAFGGALIGIMAIIIAALKASLANEKRKAVEQELEDEKVAREHSNKATEALVRGVDNENKNPDNNRNYKFCD